VIVSGSVGVVEAANSERTMEINLIQSHWDLSGGMSFIPPSASFSFNKVGVWAYEYQWYSQANIYDAPYLPFGEPQYEWFEGRQTSGTDIDLPLPSGLGWSTWYKGKVVVYLLKKNGGYVHGFGPQEPAPAMAWYSPAGSLTFYFVSYRAAGYKYQWYHDGVPVGDTQYVWFDGTQTSGSNLPVADFRGGQGTFTVEVWLINKGGHGIRDAFITAGWTAF
jgi:hypothetical protein